MLPILRNAIARIDVGASRGTGFLVADGLVLTALHVVADRKQTALTPHPGDIVLTFPTGTVKAAIADPYWDRLADWALLRCETPPETRPIPLAELRGEHVPWETYGFPDGSARDGLVYAGEIRNRQAAREGQPTFQLYSEEAAAGNGAPAKGLSGGPVIVQSAVVGLLRIALMNAEEQSVSGTLYACPIASVLQKAGKVLPQPDPCFGLPGLPRQRLPDAPFRHLQWFTAKEADVFFGRNREIRKLYERLTAEDAAPILLLYGQAGVGKSSILDAGLLPRLRWYHEVCYLRRDPQSTLLETLRDALNQAEPNTGKPLVVFFDQIEEVYTHPSAQSPHELDEFCQAIGALFGSRAKLVLSFRKEWFPEIQEQMELHELEYSKVFLTGLDRESVIEAVTGLTRTTRLQEFYGLTVESGLAAQIANDLLNDRDSPIAPTLQILLTKMWERAKAQSNSAPAMTAELYESLKKEGLLLADFLDQQLQAVKATSAEWVESGLALDVLTHHTTFLGSARECSLDDLLATYEHRRSNLPALLQELQRLFLMSDTSRDDGRKATRLCHDTLGVPVRQRYARSERPGQRAHRILEGRVDDWEEGSETGLLDEGLLAVVERGQAGMRRLTAAEQKLVDASRAQQEKAKQQQAAARFQLTLFESARLMETDPMKALMLAMAAVQRSAPSDSPDILAQGNLFRTLEIAREVNLLRHPHAEMRPLMDWSSDGQIVMYDETGETPCLRFWSPFGLPPRKPIPIPPGRESGSNLPLRVSPDCSRVALGYYDTGILLCDRERALNSFAASARCFAFLPHRDGLMLVAGTDDGKVKAFTDDGESWAARAGQASVESIAFVAQERSLIFTGGSDGSLNLFRFGDNRPFRSINLLGAGIPVTSLDVSEGPAGIFRVAAASEGHDEAFIFTMDGEFETDRALRLSFGDTASLKFSPRGDRLAVVSGRGTIRCVNPVTGEEQLPPLRRHSFDTACAFDPSGDFLALRDGNVTRIVALQGAAVVMTLKTGASGTACARFSPDGRSLASALGTTLHIWDLQTGAPLTIPHPFDDKRTISALAFSPDGRRLAAGYDSGDVCLWSITGELLQQAADPGTTIEELCFHYLGESVLIQARSSFPLVLRWDLPSNHLGPVWHDASESVHVALAPTGYSFAVTHPGQNGPAIEMRTADMFDSHGHEFPVDAASFPAFSPDGRTIILSVGRRSFSYWDSWTGNRLPPETPVGSQDEVVSGFAEVHHPHGRLFYLVEGDRERIGVYDRFTGTKIAEFRLGGKVTALSPVSSDGTRIASVQDDGTICVWQATWRQWLRTACERLQRHPILDDSAVTDPLERENIQLARDLCRSIMDS